MTYIPQESAPKYKAGTEWLLTGRTELSEGSGITPRDRSAGRAELDASQSRHVVAQNGLSELDGGRGKGGRRLSLGIEAVGEILLGDRSGMSVRVNEVIGERGVTHVEVENFAGDHHGEELFRRSRESITDGLTDVHGDLSDSIKLLRRLLLDLVFTRDGHGVKVRGVELWREALVLGR